MIEVSRQNNSGLSSVFPDMTALLDIIFILLVFLLLTANTVPKALEVALPEEGSDQAQVVEVDKRITITLFANSPKWGIDTVEYGNWRDFEQAFVQKITAAKALSQSSSGATQPEIIIAGDKQVSLEKLMKIFSWLKANDLTAAQILMDST